MITILKFAKKYWASMLVIIALLVGQAVCELALPQYCGCGDPEWRDRNRGARGDASRDDGTFIAVSE